MCNYLNFREPHYAKIGTNSRLFCWPSSCTRQVEMKLTTSSSSSLERNTKAKETISKSKTSNSRTILHFRVPTLHRALNGLNAARHPRRRPTQRAEINNIIFACGETSFSTWRLFALWRRENIKICRSITLGMKCVCAVKFDIRRLAYFDKIFNKKKGTIKKSNRKEK